MGDAHAARIWLGRTVFLAAVFVLLFADFVPLRFQPRFIPPPDLLLCLTIAFALRRPEFVPVWVLAPVYLLADILFNHPIGLWTTIVILTVEFIRTQEYRFRELVFPFEWLFVASVIFLAMLANRFILALSMVPLPSFGTVMLHFIVSLLVYPFVVFVCYYLLRVQKITPHQAVKFGYRL